MRKRFYLPTSLVLFVAVAFAWPAASFAQVKVIMSGGFSPVDELLPAFEKTSGIKVTTARGPSQGNGPDSIGAQLRSGFAADVVIMSREGMDDLIAAGQVATSSVADLAQTPLYLSVRAGAPKPDIGTPDAFKQTLLHAKSITFPSHASGIYMKDKVLSKLAGGTAISSKVTNAGAGAVASGESELGILPLSELIHAPGVDSVGKIPAEFQYISVFSAAVTAGAKEPEAARRLIAFLTSENAAQAIKKSGMEPPKTR